MQVRIPNWLVLAWTRFVDWSNKSFYKRVRRIDVLLFIGGVFCVWYYWFTAGWQWAIVGGLMYLFFMMIGLWML